MGRTILISISVVIPVYNVENYLRECLDSILKQTIGNLEIIIVNDGSTDTSYQICQEYARMDKRIILLNGENKGVSHARNAALDVATGDYILFVDADDCLTDTSLKTIANVCEKSELLICGFQRIDEKGRAIDYVNRFPQKSINREEALRLIFELTPQMGYQGYLWNKLFLNCIIQKYHIRFDESIRYNEDRLFITEYLLHVNNVYIIPEITYEYRIRTDSAMGAVNKAEHYTSAVLTELDAFEKIFKLLGDIDSQSYEYALKGAFYRSYYLLPKIPLNQKEDRNRVLEFKMKIYKECMNSSRLHIKSKVRIFIFQNIL